MVDGWLLVLTVVTALGCALMGGAFYAFSSFVMRALGRLPAPAGVAAMQSVNVEAPTPWFMAGFLGTTAACVAEVVASIVRWGEDYAIALLVGALLYLLGTFVLTIAYHIPRNDRLATVDPNSPEAAGYWAYYLRAWTRWNSVRSVAALAAATVLTVALRLG